MSRIFSRLPWLLAALGLAAALSGPAGAATPLSAADQKSIRAVVQAQIRAFAANDAERAFSFAAPGLRKSFGSARRFMEMVRTEYPMVYRPASVAFQPPDTSGELVVQRVHMTDAHGDSWMALYTLERQKDKSWRISGCNVLEDRGLTT
jgi:hypothetical protein